MRTCFTHLLLLLLLGTGFTLSAQKTISVRVATGNDDLEEYIPGPNQTKTLGSMDAGSSDLELGSEAANNKDPQLVGIRFTGISIPKGSLITRAYIQFTVDAVSKNTDPSELYIYAQDADNPLTFSPDTLFNISSRPQLKDSIFWKIPDGTWKTANVAGPDQRTPDISRLVQALVDRNGWADGNAMAFFIKGKGTREADSADDEATKAPVLVIEYVPASSLSSRVATGNDDLEEYIPGANQTKTLGSMDAGSSDLELGSEAANNKDPQLVGIRFTNLNIPKGALIRNAYIQFTVDAVSKNTDPSELYIYAQDSDNPLTFSPDTLFNISSRPQLKDSIFWKIPDGTWKTANVAGPDQRTPNMASLLQALINREGWKEGNAMAFFIKGNGTREADSADDEPQKAPLLVVEYINVSSFATQVAAANDDMEEYIPGANQTKTLGSMDSGSSDLELGSEAANNKDPQLVGIRFTNIGLSKGAKVKNAYIQFTVDAISKNTDPSELYIYAQDSDNPLTFSPDTLFNISSRPQLKDSIFWKIPDGSWKTAGVAGPDQRTPNIAGLVQALLNRDAWQPGNAMAFFIKGVGTREAESADDEKTKAPRLIIEYYSGGQDSGSLGNPVTKYPVVKGDSWSYFDGATPVDTAWAKPEFVDNSWPFGPAPLGYGETGIATTVAKGPVSHYFRKRITVDSLASLKDTLEFHLRADDGAALYINGVEQFRTNMPAGAIQQSTVASRTVTGNEEKPYFLFEVPKSAFKTGENVVAVRVHQPIANDEDLFFDLFIRERQFLTNAPAVGCSAPNDMHISCFTSIIPTTQNDTLRVPVSSHVFQFVSVEGDKYTSGAGGTGSNYDFTGYVPKNGSSKEGYLSINHETDPGGVSMLKVRYNETSGLWVVDSSQAVDFSAVAGTVRNCSGTVTPWNTIITCEEDYGNNTDTNGDGYLDIGWCIEIDPATAKVKEYGTGKAQKLWALGRCSHENVVVDPKDWRIVYYGEDDGDGSVYKFVADKAGDLSSGKLYALKLDFAYNGGDPAGTTGTWVLVPNTTPQERSDSKKSALALGATKFAGIEDVEISPINNLIYFAVKGAGRVYRFKDDGTTVSGFETFLGGKAYRINLGDKVMVEDFGNGIDNLAFDDRGNLFSLQDGGNNYVWFTPASHTNANPQVEIFMSPPRGSEPTGISFTPDFRYMFISVQEPNSSATQADVAKRNVKQDVSYALAIARTPFLGQGTPVGTKELVGAGPQFQIYPNPTGDQFAVAVELEEAADLNIQVFDLNGRQISLLRAGRHTPGAYRFEFSASASNLQTGIYVVKVNAGNRSSVRKLVIN